MQQLNGWIIYTKEDYERNQDFAQRFIDQGKEHGLSIALILKEELCFGIKNGLLWMEADKHKNLPHFVINRTLDSLLARQLEALGIKVFNNSEVSEVCNDKARTYFEAARLGLPVIDTWFLTKQEVEAWNRPVSYPLILKSVGGRGGKEVFLIDSVEQLKLKAKALQSERFVLQKLCGSPGKDVRVFVMGKRVIGAIERISEADFKANYSLGGSARIYHLNEYEQELVTRLVNRFDFGFVGIDFIFDENNQFLFNEIEDVVGSRTLCIYANINVVGLYLEHISSVMKALKQ